MRFQSAFQWPPELIEVNQAIEQCVRSGEWSQYDGENHRELTAEIQQFFGLPFARLCSSGTIAIEIALRGIGVQPGDEVILAAYDFPGNFRAIESLGAIPVLADLQERSWSISHQSMESLVTPKTRAVIVSHLHGSCANIRSIQKIAESHQIAIIEDICQCPGARLGQQILGSFGNIAAISFGGSKLLSAGRGGAVLTNSEKFSQRMRIFCERGNDAFPLSEIQASLIRPQLKRLDEYNLKRLDSARLLQSRFERAEFCSTVEIPDDIFPAFYKFPFRFNNMNQIDKLIFRLRGLGILIDHGFRGFLKRSSRRCRLAENLDHAKQAIDETLVLHHPCLLSEQLPEIADTIYDEMRQLA